MSQYQFSVGSTPSTVTGNLGWNANGTLASLGITDQFNSANSQNCTFSYDDLARIAGNPNGSGPYGVDCGAGTWRQYFTYDPFGNITKSVPSGATGASFQAGYVSSNGTNNRIQSLPGFTPTYDANGNTTADSLHTYAWDADGNSITIDTIGLTFDALDRMVEQKNGSAYTQILYGPTGKLALMNQQSVSKAFIPLPAGATAVYTSGPTLSYFRHPDWLGSSRFASTASRTMYYSGAYAPFGENYAEAGTPDRSFTGENQDTIQGTTTGLYDFLFREYAQYGRWISPDPAGLGAVNPANPQSWNRYAYVLNNPTNAVDPLGLDYCEDTTCFGLLEDGGGGPCGFGDASGLPPIPPFTWGCPFPLILPRVLIGGNGGGGTGGFPASSILPGESNGIPTWLQARGQNIWQLLFPIDPSCEFGPCAPIGNGLVSDVAGTGSPDSPYTMFVFVSAFFTSLPSVSNPVDLKDRPTYSYGDYLGCLYTELVAKQIADSDKMGVAFVVNIAPFVFKRASVFYASVATIYDAALLLNARSTCTYQVYGRF